VRLPALDFSQLPLLDAPTLASLAAATAYSGVIVWQGAFLQAALAALGAAPTALDPDSADALRGALVAPIAVALVAALEPAWFALRVRAADFLTPLLAAELKGQAGEELRASAAEFAEALVERVKEVDPAGLDAARPVLLRPDAAVGGAAKAALVAWAEATMRGGGGEGLEGALREGEAAVRRALRAGGAANALAARSKNLAGWTAGAG
jgi:hypothetical protein